MRNKKRKYPIQTPIENETILFYGRNPNPKYHCFSNFYHSPFFLNGHWWPTVEHYFQAQKSTDSDVQKLIRECKNPSDAKKLGRKINLRPDWEKVKLVKMTEAVLEKFKQNHKLKGILLSTKNAIIHEDSPYDFEWGWRNNGRDLLGKILMKVRDHLRIN